MRAAKLKARSGWREVKSHTKSIHGFRCLSATETKALW